MYITEGTFVDIHSRQCLTLAVVWKSSEIAVAARIAIANFNIVGFDPVFSLLGH
jgi:hypothetical protein